MKIYCSIRFSIMTPQIWMNEIDQNFKGDMIFSQGHAKILATSLQSDLVEEVQIVRSEWHNSKIMLHVWYRNTTHKQLFEIRRQDLIDPLIWDGISDLPDFLEELIEDFLYRPQLKEVGT